MSGKLTVRLVPTFLSKRLNTGQKRKMLGGLESMTFNRSVGRSYIATHGPAILTSQ